MLIKLFNLIKKNLINLNIIEIKKIYNFVNLNFNIELVLNNFIIENFNKVKY